MHLAKRITDKQGSQGSHASWNVLDFLL